MSSTNQDKPYDPDDPKEIQEYNNRKHTADKVRLILSNVKDNRKDSSRRWIWELIQNAKDVPNHFGQVSIDVTLDNERLVFRHNGNPFRLDNLTSLVQQISSKNSQNKDEKVTGKFGTGFISTHLLSDVITVNGILEHRTHFKDFKLVLDRKGESSEDLLPKIEAALDWLNNVDDPQQFPLIKDNSVLSQEEKLNTSFIYVFDDEENRTSAINGVKDLVNTLPVTLVNLDEVKKVTVRNKLEQGLVEYENITSKDEVNSPVKGVKKSKVTINDLTDLSPEATPLSHSFLTYKDGEDIHLTIAIDEQANAIIPIGKGSPRLYRDFPLIGSHKFHFPFILNGRRLNPTERRDGLILHSESDSKAIKNREILSRSFKAAQAFTEKLISLNISNRYLLAFTRIPDSKWTEEFSKEWITSHQVELRKFLISQPLVETSAGKECNSLEYCYIPKYSEKTETRLAFYDLATPFLGADRVPRKELLLDWIDAVGPKDEIKTWPGELYYDLDALIEDLEKCKDLPTLQEKLGEVNAIAWLQQLYGFIHIQRESDYFSSNAITPNHYGAFKKIVGNELYKEDVKDPFHDHLLGIHKTVTNKDWKGIHIHRGIDTTNIACESSTLSELSEAVNEVLSERIDTPDGNDYSFLSRQDSLQVLIDLLRIREQTSQPDNFRFRLLEYGGKLLKTEAQSLTLGNTKSVKFERATKLFIRTINRKIAACINLSGLATKLGMNEQETLDWLNEYLHLIYDNGTYTDEIKYGRIIPDQYEDFHHFENLKDPGTVDDPLPKELITALYDLDNKQDLKSKLISTKVKIRKNDAYTFSELGSNPHR
jgi:hypothetical protein